MKVEQRGDTGSAKQREARPTREHPPASHSWKRIQTTFHKDSSFPEFQDSVNGGRETPSMCSIEVVWLSSTASTTGTHSAAVQSAVKTRKHTLRSKLIFWFTSWEPWMRPCNLATHTLGKYTYCCVRLFLSKKEKLTLTFLEYRWVSRSGTMCTAVRAAGTKPPADGTQADPGNLGWLTPKDNQVHQGVWQGVGGARGGGAPDLVLLPSEQRQSRAARTSVGLFS